MASPVENFVHHVPHCALSVQHVYKRSFRIASAVLAHRHRRQYLPVEPQHSGHLTPRHDVLAEAFGVFCFAEPPAHLIMLAPTVEPQNTCCKQPDHRLFIWHKQTSICLTHRKVPKDGPMPLPAKLEPRFAHRFAAHGAPAAADAAARAARWASERSQGNSTETRMARLAKFEVRNHNIPSCSTLSLSGLPLLLLPGDMWTW